MIHVANPIPEPPHFDATCRQPGTAWWEARRVAGDTPKTSEFPNLWSQYEGNLALGFHQRCGWWAMWIANGEVDHFLSKRNHPHLAYEWSNYRYIAGSVNGSKGTHDDRVLDPFEVQDGWFEVILPSMQLIVTRELPAALKEKAEFTLRQLHLRDGTKVVRSRLKWYHQYKSGKLTFEGLQDDAPLVAKAVKKLQEAGEDLP